MGYLHDKFSYSRGDVYRNIASVMPDNDIITRIGHHIDIAQRIECIDYLGNPRGHLSCPMLYHTACELWRVCGDVNGRDWGQLCFGTNNPDKEPAVNVTCLGRKFHRGNCP